MRIGTKILLLMLLITVGSLAIVSWIVTLNVTSHETERANDQISLAIGHYMRHLDERHEQIIRIVQALLEAPAQRSLLQAADDSSDTDSREQLKQEVFGRNVQTELQSRDGSPTFHVLLNQANEFLLATSPGDPELAKTLASPAIHWPVDAVVASGARPVIQYVSTPAGLFLAMGVPLHTQLNALPTHAYFVGFRVDDVWVRQQLLADGPVADSFGAQLAAWFVVGDKVVARASSQVSDNRFELYSAQTPTRLVNAAGRPAIGAITPKAGAPSSVRRIEFSLGGERFLGQSSNLNPADNADGQLVLASSLDAALIPLHALQWKIFATAIIACFVALAACRAIALMISRPIGELVAGTQRIAQGKFDDPVKFTRRDELGTLADSMNLMSQGLKERDGLREERVKIERDLTLARKIQMDVLPKKLPTCPGYDIAAFSLPAEQTGGDIYDLVAVALDPEHPDQPPSWVLLLADATGHGIGPALCVTQVRSMLRIGVRLRAELEEILSQINRQLCHDLGSQRFVTAFLGLLDTAKHNIDYRSAGQAPLLHFHGKNHSFEWLDSSMLPLGVMEDPMSDGPRMMQIETGDLIVLLTDGFYEAANPEGDMLGRERIGEIILQHHHRPARELLDEILKATREFSRGEVQADDMTGLIIRRLPPD